MEEKKFQLITWKLTNESKDVTIKSLICENIDEIEVASFGCNLIMAIGLNPSNKTVFNDDVTNFYLRDKIARKFNCVDGYILTNLSYKVETDCNKISISDVKKDHIENIIGLIDKFKDSVIIIFFGQKGKELLNNKRSDAKEALQKLKAILNDKTKKVFYTQSKLGFVHPGHQGGNYELAKLKENTLKMEN